MPLDFSTTTFPFRISNLCPSIVTVRIAVWKNDFHPLYFAVEFSLSLIQWRIFYLYHFPSELKMPSTNEKQEETPSSIILFLAHWQYIVRDLCKGFKNIFHLSEFLTNESLIQALTFLLASRVSLLESIRLERKD